MLINDVNPSTYGFVLSDSPGWLDGPPMQTPSGVVLRRGSRPLGTPTDQPRRLSLRGYIIGSTASQARTYLDTLKQQLYRGPAKVSFSDILTRYYNVYLESFVTPPLAYGSHIARKLRVEATLVAFQPYAIESSVTTVSGAGAMALGTGPVRPVVTLTGASNPVTHSLLDKDGNTVSSMVIAAAGTIIVDHDAQTITDDGVLNLNALTSGDFFVIDPAEARFQGAGPTITSSGTSSHSISYRKTWR